MYRTRSPWPARALVLLSVALSLMPLGRLGLELVRYTDLGLPLAPTPLRGTDGVLWRGPTPGGGFQAAHVVPRSPADQAGLAVGDVVTRIDAQAIESRAELRQTVERATGAVLRYDLDRDGRAVRLDVPIVRAPTFLYPLTPAVWTASAWGFALAAGVHVLALVIVFPLRRTSARGRRATALIAAATAWVGGNLARIGWVATVGQPGGGPAGDAAFAALTLIALAGWVAFPALLLRQVLLSDRRLARATAPVRAALWVPPVVLGGGMAWAMLAGHVGPLPPDAFVIPVLFYVCVTVAAATALSLGVGVGDSDWTPPVWSRVGSALVLVVASAGALVVWFGLPAYRPDAGSRAEGFVTALQLFSVLPVSLVSLSTLRHGPVDVVLSRGLAYLAVLGVVFAVVAGGTALLDAAVPGPEGAGPVALALLLVGITVLIERSTPLVRRQAERLLGSERAAAAALLDRFAVRVQTLLDPETLAREAAATVGAAFKPESAVVSLRVGPDRWVQGGYRPTPPHFTEDELREIWSAFEARGQVWSRNPDLSEAALSRTDEDRLRRLGVALAVPMLSPDDETRGLIALGRRPRLRVYTTADVGRLRTLGAQLGLAVERLSLIERETALVRQTAEAELTALRAQINPHFLFNALNTVSSLIAEQPDAAEETLQSLAGLFRDVLTASGRAHVPLRDELGLVRRYLDVEEARFGDKLRVTVDADAAVLDREVPAFAVQTLVENAVKHGLERKRGGGRLALTARADGDGALVVTVADTGVGIPALFGRAGHPEPPLPDAPAGDKLEADPFFGVGLSNVHDRLRQLYGDGDWLRHTSSPDETVATLRIPA